jgi:hypothetical protein
VRKRGREGAQGDINIGKRSGKVRETTRKRERYRSSVCVRDRER